MASPAAVKKVNPISQSIQEEARYIRGLQLESGAIATAPGAAKIEPYFANLALIGLLDLPYKENLQTARNWMAWYAGHLNKPDRFGVDGTVYVYEYDLSAKTEKSAADYDSSDSYGATFLTLAAKYAGSGGDASFIRSLRVGLETVAGSVLFTQQKNGLTYAKADHPVAYLMDNCEVYRGLVDISALEKSVFRDSEKSKFYAGKAELVRRGIEKMWNPSTKTYQPYAGRPADLKVFYPDAVSQMFPITNGVIPPKSDQAKQIYSNFNKFHNGWGRLEKSDPFPWMAIGFAASLMNDKKNVDLLRGAVDSKFPLPRTWPWYNAESGFLIRMLSFQPDH